MHPVDIGAQLLRQRIDDAGTHTRLRADGIRRHPHAIVADRQGPIPTLPTKISVLTQTSTRSATAWISDGHLRTADGVCQLAAPISELY